LLTGGADGTARLWDISRTGVRDGITVPGPALRFVGSIAFSPDGRSLAVPGQHRGVTMRDVDTGRKLITLKVPEAPISTLAFSPDGTRLAAATLGPGTPHAIRSVPIWDVATGDLVMTLHPDRWMAAVAFSPDGSTDAF
jgi:WD40 repeat protein